MTEEEFVKLTASTIINTLIVLAIIIGFIWIPEIRREAKSNNEHNEYQRYRIFKRISERSDISYDDWELLTHSQRDIILKESLGKEK